MASAVIFDCDGVLFDSWRANVAYYNAIREQLGLGVMDAEWERRAHFLAASQLLETMFADAPEQLALARDVAKGTDYGPFYELMDPAPGLFGVLDALKERHRLGMATNRGQTVQGVVERFGLARWFDAAVGLLDVARPKPAPDVILACAERLGVEPAWTVYVGDAETDLEAARAAGVHFVAVHAPAWSPVGVATFADLPAMLPAVPLGTTPAR
jgi:HAD superfamily hydrolase (TIGR01509 family)